MSSGRIAVFNHQRGWVIYEFQKNKTAHIERNSTNPTLLEGNSVKLLRDIGHVVDLMSDSSQDRRIIERVAWIAPVIIAN